MCLERSTFALPQSSTSAKNAASVGASHEKDAGKTGEEEGQELERLSKLVGSWKETAELPGGTKLVANGKTRWILGRTHVQSNYVIEMEKGKNMQHMMLLTWDGKLKKYRSWMFSSDSKSLESTGVWDQESNALIMTSQADDDGNVTTSKTVFTSKDVSHWTVETKDKNGNVTFSMKGVDERVEDRVEDRVE